jgi:hypothetical protein
MTYRDVPVHTIPHVLLAYSADSALRTWLCLPALYYPGQLPYPYEAHIYHLYEEVLRPTWIAHHVFPRSTTPETIAELQGMSYVKYQQFTKKYVAVTSDTILAVSQEIIH